MRKNSGTTELRGCQYTSFDTDDETSALVWLRDANVVSTPIHGMFN